MGIGGVVTAPPPASRVIDGRAVPIPLAGIGIWFVGIDCMGIALCYASLEKRMLEAMSPQLSPDQFKAMHEAIKEPGGGFTQNVHTGQMIHSGWLVAEPDHEHTFPMPGTHDEIEKYHAAHRDTIEAAGHIGGWHNPADNHGYLDASKVHQNNYAGGAQAIASSYKNRQLAAVNLDTFNMLHTHPGESIHTRDARGSGAISPEAASKINRASPTHASEQKESRTAMAGIRRQRPERARRVASMPARDLAADLRNRR